MFWNCSIKNIPREHSKSVEVNYSKFVDESFELVTLLDDVEQIEKEESLQSVIGTYPR